MSIASDVTRATTTAASMNGKWRNRMGSVMELVVSQDDRVTGTFKSGVGTPHPGSGYNITGYAVGNALTFCVDFRPHGSVAAWTGHHIQDGHGERLVTLWHLAQPIDTPRSDSDIWQGVLAGANEFEREA